MSVAEGTGLWEVLSVSHEGAQRAAIPQWVSSSPTLSCSMFCHLTKGPEDSHGSDREVTESSFWKMPRPPPPSR